MIILPVGPENYLPPRIFDKATARVDIKGRIKAPLTLNKETFESPDNPKAPKTCFVVGHLMKFHFATRKEMENSKMVYDRDSDPKTQGKKPAKGDEEEEEDEEGEEDDS